MKNHLSWIIITMTLLSCERNIELDEIINSNSPFIFTQRIKKVNSGQFEFISDTLNINSEKWNELSNFLKKNHDNWKSTPASYIPDFYIEQDEFRLLVWKEGKTVVISFRGENGKSEQLIKGIEKGELDFLNE